MDEFVAYVSKEDLMLVRPANGCWATIGTLGEFQMTWTDSTYLSNGCNEFRVFLKLAKPVKRSLPP